MKRAKLKEPEFWTILKTLHQEKSWHDKVLDDIVSELTSSIDKEILEELLGLGDSK